MGACVAHLFVIGLSIVSFSTKTSSKKVTSKETEDEESYIFPEIYDGNALQPTLTLLQNQLRYHTKIDDIYKKMMKKNRNAQNLKQIEAVIFNTRIIIKNEIEKLRGYIEKGTPSEDIKREPWIAASSYSVLNSWRAIKELSTKMKGEGVDKEINTMQKPLNLATHEMEMYEKYSDKVFEENQKTTTEGDESSAWN